MKTMSASFLLRSILIFPTVFLVSCDSEPSWKKHDFKAIKKTNSSAEVEIPKSLWEKVESIHVDSKAPQEAERSKAESKALPPTEFAPLTIYLVEKNQGVLRRGDTKISFTAGGGEIDLSEFVENRNGSFKFVAEFLPEVDGLTTRVFFLGNSPVRELDGERWGSGCDAYFDISSAMTQARKKDGILVNTTDGRHVSALAGTYVFAAIHEGKLKLASLVIRDSIRKNLLCRR